MINWQLSQNYYSHILHIQFFHLIPRTCIFHIPSRICNEPNFRLLSNCQLDIWQNISLPLSLIKHKTRRKDSCMISNRLLTGPYKNCRCNGIANRISIHCGGKYSQDKHQHMSRLMLTNSQPCIEDKNLHLFQHFGRNFQADLLNNFICL